MPSDGEEDDGLTDWLGPLCCWACSCCCSVGGGYEDILFGEAADDAWGDFVVGGRLVVFSGNIDSEFLLRVRNIV
jgi:hypothetical protein